MYAQANARHVLLHDAVCMPLGCHSHAAQRRLVQSACHLIVPYICGVENALVHLRYIHLMYLLAGFMQLMPRWQWRVFGVAGVSSALLLVLA
jgi:hypothetical protein